MESRSPRFARASNATSVPFGIQALILASALLGACDSDDDGGDRPLEDPGVVSGVLIVPRAAAESTERLLAAHRAPLLLRMAECDAVPEGYAPLVGAVVTFVDAEGNAVGGELVTDECGAFGAPVPAGATSVRASAEGFRDIETDVTTFSGSGEAAALASTIPLDASFRIGSLRRLDDDRVAFTVTDSLTNQAVLGIPASAFDVRLDDNPVEILDVAFSASAADVASTALVLDSSGSMQDVAYIDPETGDQFDRSQLTTLAAHAFLDQKGGDDEVAAIIFGSAVRFIDQDFVDARLRLSTADGDALDYDYGESGYVTDARRMRLIIDAYNPSSELYRTGGDARHPDTPDEVRVDRYPFGGRTALFDAIVEGVERTEARPIARQFVVAMTDGRNNASRNGEDDVIDAALAANMPVYTIGFGPGVNERALADIAETTGATYFAVTDTDVANAFQSIQTGILFQYIARLLPDTGLATALTLTVGLSYSGLDAEREVGLGDS